MSQRRGRPKCGKVHYHSEDEAWLAREGMILEGKTARIETLVPYVCRWCGSKSVRVWHLGHARAAAS